MGRTRLVAVLLACAAALPAFGGDSGPSQDADLAKAKQLLTGNEGSVTEGANLCLKLNSAASMALLLDVLRAEQPHMRDIVWDVIPKFTDAYARQAVAAELRGNGRNRPMREWCAQALGEFGVADFLGTLKTQLTSTDDSVRAAAARAIGRIKDPAAAASLKDRLHDTDAYVRAEAVEALARVSRTDGKGPLWEALRDADAGVRCAVLGVVPELYPDLAEETAATALTDADWRPRMQAVENLCAARTKTAIDALVRATGDGRPVVAAKAVGWLQGVTTLKFTERTQWETWWKANRETFKFPEATGSAAPADDKGRTFAAFNGLEVTSDHVAFVIDKSSDMLRSLKNGKTKDATAFAELDATLSHLAPGVVFDVVTYGAKVQSFAKKPSAFDPKTRAAALKFVAAVPCDGRKDIWAVLEEVVRDGTIDTVYLLSSGEPETGLYVHWNRVCDHLVRLNRHFKVVVHGVSYTDSAWFRSQIEHIALATGGKFVAKE
jgi:hypothetical protein